MKDLFALVGLFFIGLIVCSILALAWQWIKEEIHLLKWRYKYKHRFDKSPTAKCYCIDCKNHGSVYKNNWCYRFDRCTADNWFCWEAEPKDKGDLTAEADQT